VALARGRWVPPADRDKKIYPLVGRVPRRRHSALRALRQRVAVSPVEGVRISEDRRGWLQLARRRLDPAFDRACAAHDEGRYTEVPLEELAYQYRVGKL
jgi:hypothetical protein